MCFRRRSRISAPAGRGQENHRRRLERWLARKTGSVLAEHGLKQQELTSSLSQALSLRDGRVALAVIGLEAGFVAGDLAVIGEQDILGDRLAPQRRRKKRGANFLAEVAALSAGDLVVHVDHGIGRFIGLKQIEAAARRMTAWSCITSPATSSSAGRKYRAVDALRLGRARKRRSTGSAMGPGASARRV